VILNPVLREIYNIVKIRKNAKEIDIRIQVSCAAPARKLPARLM
jgi:hypothetical protein